MTTRAMAFAADEQRLSGSGARRSGARRESRSLVTRIEPPDTTGLEREARAPRGVGGYRSRRREQHSDRLPVADLDHQRVEIHDRVDLLQRPGLPGLGVLQHRGGDPADRLAADPGPVQLGDVGLDLAGGHPAGVQGDDLLVQPGQTPLALADQLRLKAALAVPRSVDPHRALVGQERLGRPAVARVPHPARRRVPGRIAQMLGQLLLERALDHPAGDLAEHAVLSEDLALASLAGDQLVDHPVQQPLAQLIRQPVALGSELIKQRVDQRLPRIVGHSRHRSSQPGVVQRLLDHLLAQGACGFRAPHRERRIVAGGDGGTLTLSLGVTGTLLRTLSSTNCIESMSTPSAPPSATSSAGATATCDCA